MTNVDSLESLLVKQTCRSFAYKFKMNLNQTSEDTPSSDIYSLEFLKNLHDNPQDNLNRIIENVLSTNATQKECSGDNRINEKVVLFNFFKKVNSMKSEAAKQWADLQHYLCFIYRYCMSSDPEPEQEVLSPYFIAEMRGLVYSLMEEDDIQLCLRVFSLIREYTVFAHKQHQKIANAEASIESLFFYYEAFLSATKNICKILPELEKLLVNTYKLGWLDFNTSIFMYYFYETTYVQHMIKEFELMKDNVSIKAAGFYTVLTELHKLWRSQMLGINGVIANKLGVKFKGLDSNMMQGHRKILCQNFWIDRSADEKSSQDVSLFDYQLFTLVGDKSSVLPEATLNQSGQCICENCLLIKYKAILDGGDINKTSSDCMRVSCRFCHHQINLDHFQKHILLELEGKKQCRNSSKLPRIISDKIDIVKSGMTANSKILNWKNPQGNSLKRLQDNGKDPSPKIANEPPIFKNDLIDDDIDVTKLSYKDIDGSKMSRKTFYNFLKYRNSTLRNDKDGKIDKSLTADKVKTNLAKTNDLNRSPPSELNKNPKGANGSNKNGNVTFSCGHSCKLEEELKSEFKKAYQETCDHHKDSKKCDCTFCEVFGTSSNIHKANETRNRLRIRLNQRNEKVVPPKNPPKTTFANTNNNPIPTVNNNNHSNSSSSNSCSSRNDSITTIPAANGDDSSNPLINDIHGLLNYIEGNTTDTVVLADKKAAKKQRQRDKREQERLQIEEDERKKAEEEQKKIREALRLEKLEKQMAEKAKNSKKERKKLRNKMKESAKTNSDSMEETIPAMVTIKRVVEKSNSLPTVTITLKGSTPDQDKLLYTLVNGHEGGDGSNQSTDNKKSKKKKQTNGKSETSESNDMKKKNSNNYGKQNSTVFSKEIKVTLSVDPQSICDAKKKAKVTAAAAANKKGEVKKEKDRKNNGAAVMSASNELNLPMLKLPPGITITKVEGPMVDRSYRASNVDGYVEAPPYPNANIPVSKSGVIVVDTEKLIKQSSVSTTATSKKARKKKKKQDEVNAEAATKSSSSMVTLKNPIFQNLQPNRRQNADPATQQSVMSNGQCQQASIFKNENGMVTIRSSRLQNSLSNGTPMGGILTDLKPVLGPEVTSAPFVSNCAFVETSKISPFNAQEILSGLPGIEITKVDKNSTKNEVDNKKNCHTAEVSIIPAMNGDKFGFDKDDLHYDNVFTPRDVLEDDMDADERELEAFKRFCQQSVPPKRKEKVAHLNVKDIVLKKKNDEVSG